MADSEQIRISKVIKELNIGLDSALEFLSSKGVAVEKNPNSKIDAGAYGLLLGQFSTDKKAKDEADAMLALKAKKEPVAPPAPEPVVVAKVEPPKPEPVVVPEPVVENKPEKVVIKATKKTLTKEEQAEDVIRASVDGDNSVTVVGKIDLDALNSKTKPDKKTKAAKEKEKKEKEDAVVAEKAAAKEKSKTTKTTKKKTEEIVVEEAVAPVVKSEEVVVVEKPAIVEPDTNERIITADNTQSVAEQNIHVTSYTKIEGPKVMGSIELPKPPEKKKVGSSQGAPYNPNDPRQKRKRIKKNVNINDPKNFRQNTPGTPSAPGTQTGGGGYQGNNPRPAGTGYQGNNPRPAGAGYQGTNPRPGGGYQGNNNRNAAPRAPKAELTPEEIQAQIKETLARLSGSGKSKASKHRRTKRETFNQQQLDKKEQNELDKSVIKVTEFVSASELAKMMDVQVNEVISTCMSLGMFVSINQRLNAETITIVAEEFGFTVEFVSAESTVDVVEDIDNPEDLLPRSPIVTVMGHVDHGKTSLLDYIRKANVIAGEAGGITQHIGAYNVKLESGKSITFLDTPGHEAFTAMRARGAQVTDIVIVVVAADDNVMPQTKEAINHAQAAGVPIVFAINKIDKPGANPDKIREELSANNILVEEWGGKYQCQEISAKKGTGIDVLLEKVLLEAEILDLKANPSKKAVGTVIESSLDKGRGYISTILVQAGTMKVGDVVLAGSFSGRVKALTNERNVGINGAGPSIPALMLGLSGAPQAGDTFKVMDDEREAREIATRRLQLMREQGIRTQKHITLDEIGRRLAIGDFQELNIIVKGDVDGSIEALTDSLLKLSTDKVQVNVIHKSVGQVTESDVLLASASNAIIVGFQVRPSTNARKLAEQEQIDIRMYSIIYDAIDEIKAAMEGMLAPEFEEKIVCNVSIRQVFNISKVGTIAGCMVTDGKISRNTKVRVIRDGIVIHTGSLGSLKRFKDDVKEVATGYECGLDIAGFNDIKEGDTIEGYEMVEIKKKL